jgi:hypothetical protein
VQNVGNRIPLYETLVQEINMAKTTPIRTVLIDGNEYKLPTHVSWRPSSRCFAYQRSKVGQVHTKLFDEKYPDVDAAYKAAIAYARNVDGPSKATKAKPPAKTVFAKKVVAKKVTKSKAQPPAEKVVPTFVTPAEFALDAKIDLVFVEKVIKKMRVKAVKRLVDDCTVKMYDKRDLQAYVGIVMNAEKQIEAAAEKARLAQEKREAALEKEMREYEFSPERISQKLDFVLSSIQKVSTELEYLVRLKGELGALVGGMQAIVYSQKHTQSNQLSRFGELVARMEMRLNTPTSSPILPPAPAAHVFGTMDVQQNCGSPVHQNGVSFSMAAPLFSEPENKPKQAEVKPQEESPAAIAPEPEKVVVSEEPPALKKLVAIVGIHPNHRMSIEREFGKQFDLSYYTSEKASGPGYINQLEKMDAVYALMTNLNDGIRDTVKGAGHRLVRLQGGLSGLRTELTKFVLGQTRSDFPVKSN